MSLIDDLGVSDSSPRVVRLDTVTPESVEWLWPGRIPRGKPTLLIGDPGLGKSFLLLDIISRLSRGAAWPDGGRAPCGDSVLLTAEDGLADTVRPRLDVQHADVHRVHALTAVREADTERSFNLEVDLRHLESVIKKTGAVLVGIDPLSAYLGDRDSYKDSEIRGVLGPLAALAERAGVAIVGIVHLTKDQQRKALYRALGSVAFVAAARVVLAIGKDPEDEDRRVLVTVKNNLAKPAPALAFTLKTGTLDWYAGTVEGVSPESVLGQGATPEEREESRVAEAYLTSVLSGGDIRATEGLAGARANGISPRTLERARRKLSVRADRVGGVGSKGTWWWSLPKAATKTATPQEVAVLGQVPAETNGTPPTSPKTATSQGVAVYGGGLRRDAEAPKRSSLPPKAWP